MAIRLYVLDAGETYRLVRDAPPPQDGVIVSGDEARYAAAWGLFPAAVAPAHVAALPSPAEVDAGEMTVDEKAVRLDGGRLLDAVAVYLGDDAYPIGLDYHLEDAAGAIWDEHTALYSTNVLTAARSAAVSVMQLGKLLPYAALAGWLTFGIALAWRMGLI